MFNTDRSKHAFVVLRVLLAVLISIHGWHRIYEGGVVEFGQALSKGGWPFGVLLAGTVTALETLAAPLFAMGRLVFPLSLIYSFIYTMGIYLHHLRNGWFSSGSDADGCEYPVLLIVAFLCVGWQYAPRWKAAGASRPTQATARPDAPQA